MHSLLWGIYLSWWSSALAIQCELFLLFIIISPVSYRSLKGCRTTQQSTKLRIFQKVDSFFNSAWLHYTFEIEITKLWKDIFRNKIKRIKRSRSMSKEIIKNANVWPYLVRLSPNILNICVVKGEAAMLMSKALDKATRKHDIYAVPRYEIFRAWWYQNRHS